MAIRPRERGGGDGWITVWVIVTANEYCILSFCPFAPSLSAHRRGEEKNNALSAAVRFTFFPSLLFFFVCFFCVVFNLNLVGTQDLCRFRLCHVRSVGPKVCYVVALYCSKNTGSKFYLSPSTKNTCALPASTYVGTYQPGRSSRNWGKYEYGEMKMRILSEKKIQNTRLVRTCLTMIYDMS